MIIPEKKKKKRKGKKKKHLMQQCNAGRQAMSYRVVSYRVVVVSSPLPLLLYHTDPTKKNSLPTQPSYVRVPFVLLPLPLLLPLDSSSPPPLLTLKRAASALQHISTSAHQPQRPLLRLCEGTRPPWSNHVASFAHKPWKKTTHPPDTRHQTPNQKARRGALIQKLSNHGCSMSPRVVCETVSALNTCTIHTCTYVQYSTVHDMGGHFWSIQYLLYYHVHDTVHCTYVHRYIPCIFSPFPCLSVSLGGFFLEQ
ncbi:hypothetical protein K504DRAFT_2111 [Pleomassaria siparia CBS 279.74]|uniref:Uncharacterized protein n=1 Tax=Pleomassaria siparia CBS 279.74 TaxID=1314801 RepID=A0A6G1KNE8_9PLEO|nr:hypothetical protein K504DRAFT_2111 [Pleomassaria siparia CBS 279.74]